MWRPKTCTSAFRGMKDSSKAQQERRSAQPDPHQRSRLGLLYRDGDLTASVTIADFVMGVIPKPDQYEALENLLRDFIAQRPQTITSPRELAERMAGKDILRKTLAEDEALQSGLTTQYQAFKENLIHDITPEDFSDISAKGIELRKLHMMDPETIGQALFPFTGDGDNVVDKPRFEDGRVWINASQYFDSAPEISWGFYIGGYQPAPKWLKDRKGRAPSFDDVKHYQRILKILAEIDKIIGTITMELEPPTP